MNASTAIVEVTEIRCPLCDGDAIYRYGRIKTGAQRFLCLVCGSQFTFGAKKSPVKGKPACPECGKPMNIYKLEGNVIRFRCSGYPVCKTFRKFTMKEAK
jgi:transposase-like protein